MTKYSDPIFKVVLTDSQDVLTGSSPLGDFVTGGQGGIGEIIEGSLDDIINI